MSDNQRWPLAEAEQVAQEVVAKLTDYCEVIQVAGSVRRRKPDVGDVELLVVPRHTLDLFSEPGPNLLDPRLLELIDRRFLNYRLNKLGRKTYGTLNKNLWHVDSGIAVDVFTGSLENWGRDLLIRTGSADFNKRVMFRFITMGLNGHAYGRYAVTGPKSSLTAPREEDMFRYLDWDFIHPSRRL